MVPVTVTSPAFDGGGFIPSKYTCDGIDVRSAVSGIGLPAGTDSIAILCDDPDAPVGDWVHWIAYNVPPDMNGIPENFSGRVREYRGVLEGLNDFRKEGWGGPCPPRGVHRYFFKVFFLDTLLEDRRGISKLEFLRAVKEHMLGYGELIGKYQSGGGKG